MVPLPLDAPIPLYATLICGSGICVVLVEVQILGIACISVAKEGLHGVPRCARPVAEDLGPDRPRVAAMSEWEDLSVRR